MRIFVTLLFLSGSLAHADQIVDLKPSEVQSAQFLSRCAHELAGKSYSIISGSRGTFQQGIMIAFKLKSNTGQDATLQITWSADTKAYACKLFEPRQ